MNHQVLHLAPGLYFVATPIGAARDITLRALDILASADVIAAEDTRSLRRLLDIHGVPLGARQVIAYHDHSGSGARHKLLSALSAGKSVAYASEAGTPLIADPGYDLGREAAAAGYMVTTAPGPSAVVAALTLAGLPTDSFFFAGFLPSAKGARRTRLQDLAGVPATLVIYESPRRVAASLADMAEILGPDRSSALCRELTKKFEEVRRGSLADLAADVGGETLKGEIVLVVDRGHGEKIGESDVEAALVRALESLSVKDAAEVVARAHGIPKRRVYQMALKLEADDDT